MQDEKVPCHPFSKLSPIVFFIYKLHKLLKKALLQAQCLYKTLREKCPNTKFSVLSCIQSEYRKMQTRKNSIFGHFSRSERRMVIHIKLPFCLRKLIMFTTDQSQKVH